MSTLHLGLTSLRACAVTLCFALTGTALGCGDDDPSDTPGTSTAPGTEASAGRGGAKSDADGGTSKDMAPGMASMMNEATGATGECNTCRQTECGPEQKACTADSNCSGLVACVAACKDGDDPCAEACLTKFEDSLELVLALVDCQQKNCFDACQ